MLKLIKLEWKKNNIGKYIRNAIIIAALLCLFVFALAFLGIANDPDGTPVSYTHLDVYKRQRLYSVRNRQRP